jgi:hypothetical protein
MHGPINVKSPKNISKWQMGFNSAFKGLRNVRMRKEVLSKISVSVRRGGSEVDLIVTLDEASSQVCISYLTTCSVTS